jgi:ABC-type transport system involved in cytochrome c biogenesis ATPase subunit
MSNIENRVITNISKDDLGDVFFANKEFEWSEIPDFAVITGINGSGKTRLLKAISGKYSPQIFFKAADIKN